MFFLIGGGFIILLHLKRCKLNLFTHGASKSFLLRKLIQRCPCVLEKLEFGSVSFSGGRKTEEPIENPWSRSENQQQTQPTYGVNGGIEPGSHWWEASALITAPYLPLTCMLIGPTHLV